MNEHTHTPSLSPLDNISFEFIPEIKLIHPENTHWTYNNNEHD